MLGSLESLKFRTSVLFLQNHFHWNSFWIGKKIWSEKILVLRKILGLKKFASEKYFQTQIFFRPKICSDPKWISMKMIFGGIKQSFWTWGFLNCPSQRFYLNWSLTLKTKSCFTLKIFYFRFGWPPHLSTLTCIPTIFHSFLVSYLMMVWDFWYGRSVILQDWYTLHLNTMHVGNSFITIQQGLQTRHSV